ncbi:MAG TPA: hypothetical protein VFJ15_04885 [Oleiagrimonas sp.]|nr:hypothetical protein [Oleiagrimonas sp.]
MPEKAASSAQWTHGMHGDVTDIATVSAWEIGIRKPRGALGPNTCCGVPIIVGKAIFIPHHDHERKDQSKTHGIGRQIG